MTNKVGQVLDRLDVNMYVAKAKEFAIRHRYVISVLSIVGLLLIGVNAWLSYETGRAYEMLWIENSEGDVTHDWESAVEIAQLPARLGYGQAEGALCHFYSAPVSEVRNYRKAVPWCESYFRSKGGNPIRLGLMYLSGGDGLQHDYQKARKYLEISADRGVQAAAAGLADIYRDGLGVPVDYETAVMWNEILLQLLLDDRLWADDYDIHRAKRRIAELAEEMEVSEISRAQIRAAEWMAEYEERRGR